MGQFLGLNLSKAEGLNPRLRTSSQSSMPTMVSAACQSLPAEAVGKRPSVPIPSGLPSSLITAAYFYVRLIPRDFGSLASGHFPSTSEKWVFRQLRLMFLIGILKRSELAKMI